MSSDPIVMKLIEENKALALRLDKSAVEIAELQSELAEIHGAPALSRAFRLERNDARQRVAELESRLASYRIALGAMVRRYGPSTFTSILFHEVPEYEIPEIAFDKDAARGDVTIRVVERRAPVCSAPVAYINGELALCTLEHGHRGDHTYVPPNQFTA